jgi:hypothetical protein
MSNKNERLDTKEVLGANNKNNQTNGNKIHNHRELIDTLTLTLC